MSEEGTSDSIYEWESEQFDAMADEIIKKQKKIEKVSPSLKINQNKKIT